jgi:hypothetical protein
VDDREWQAQHIVGERQTPSELEYEVSVRKTLWLPKVALHVNWCGGTERGSKQRPEFEKGARERPEMMGLSSIYAGGWTDLMWFESWE